MWAEHVQRRGWWSCLALSNPTLQFLLNAQPGLALNLQRPDENRFASCGLRLGIEVVITAQCKSYVIDQCLDVYGPTILFFQFYSIFPTCSFFCSYSYWNKDDNIHILLYVQQRNVKKDSGICIGKYGWVDFGFGTNICILQTPAKKSTVS